jgi:hypothetical protein
MSFFIETTPSTTPSSFIVLYSLISSTGDRFPALCTEIAAATTISATFR